MLIGRRSRYKKTLLAFVMHHYAQFVNRVACNFHALVIMSASCMNISSGLSELVHKFGGANYDKAVYFHPNVNKIGQDAWRIDNADIKTYLKPLVGEETIIWAGIYKTPMWYLQPTDLIAFHAFVVFQTRNWWWPAEKTTDGVSICRGKTRSSVRSSYRSTNRKTPIEEIIADQSHVNLQDMIDFLYDSNLVKGIYNVVTNSCHTFASALFNELAATHYVNHIELRHAKPIDSEHAVK